MRGKVFRCLMVVSLMWFGGIAQAQETNLPRSSILLLDTDRLFNASRYGQGVADRIEAEQAVLRTENRRIEAELIEEEKKLTEKRPTMAMADFRAVAEAFDRRVQEIRQIQDAKAERLLRMREEEQAAFAKLVQPVLISIMQETEATVLLNSRTVVFSIDSVDITDLAIERLNALVGDGSDTQQEEQDQQ